MRFMSSSSGTRSGAITWGLTYGLVGYYGGAPAANAITSAGTYALIAIGAVAGALLAFWWWRRRRRRAAEGAPGGSPVGSPGGPPVGSQQPEQPGESAE